MHIKIHLDEGANTGNSSQGTTEPQANTEAIINACVETVMEILEKQKER